MSDLFAYLDTSGPLYDYLGHFRQMRWIEQGHNDIDDAERVDEYLQSYGEAQAPNQPAQYVGGA